MCSYRHTHKGSSVTLGPVLIRVLCCFCGVAGQPELTRFEGSVHVYGGLIEPEAVEGDLFPRPLIFPCRDIAGELLAALG